MDYTMQLTEEQQAILDGAQGETMARGTVKILAHFPTAP